MRGRKSKTQLGRSRSFEEDDDTSKAAVVPLLRRPLRPGGGSRNKGKPQNEPIEVVPLPFVWVIRFSLLAVCGATLIMQIYEFSLGTLLEFFGILILVLVIWDVIIVSIGKKKTSFLIVSISQNIVFVVLLSIFLVTLNAWIYQLRSIPVNADLQILIDLYPRSLVDVAGVLTSVVVNLVTAVVLWIYRQHRLASEKEQEPR